MYLPVSRSQASIVTSLETRVKAENRLTEKGGAKCFETAFAHLEIEASSLVIIILVKVES